MTFVGEIHYKLFLCQYIFGSKEIHVLAHEKGEIRLVLKWCQLIVDICIFCTSLIKSTNYDMYTCFSQTATYHFCHKYLIV